MQSRFWLSIFLSVFTATQLFAEEKRAHRHPFEQEILAFEASDATNPPPQGAIVFVGSSSIRKWETLREDFAGITVIGRGFGGSQIADSTYYADRIVLPYHPRQIVLYAGDNDIAAGKTPEQVRHDFQGFVAQVRRTRPDVPIAFISIKPSLARWSLIDRIRKANQLVGETCQKQPHLEFIDIFGPMLGPDGKPRPDLLASDGLHLSRKGYRLWTEIIRSRLRG